MNYQISEEELNRLERLQGQLDLIAGLCAMAGEDSSLISVKGLLAFLDERSSDLKRVLEAATTRQECSLAQKTMKYCDWVFALRIAGGNTLSMPGGAAQSITDKLMNEATVDGDMSSVLSEWRSVLARTNETSNKPRQRRRKAATTQ